MEAYKTSVDFIVKNPDGDGFPDVGSFYNDHHQFSKEAFISLQ